VRVIYEEVSIRGSLIYGSLSRIFHGTVPPPPSLMVPSSRTSTHRRAYRMDHLSGRYPSLSPRPLSSLSPFCAITDIPWGYSQRVSEITIPREGGSRRHGAGFHKNASRPIRCDVAEFNVPRGLPSRSPMGSPLVLPESDPLLRFRDDSPTKNELRGHCGPKIAESCRAPVRRNSIARMTSSDTDSRCNGESTSLIFQRFKDAQSGTSWRSSSRTMRCNVDKKGAGNQLSFYDVDLSAPTSSSAGTSRVATQFSPRRGGLPLLLHAPSRAIIRHKSRWSDTRGAHNRVDSRLAARFRGLADLRIARRVRARFPR